MNKRGRYSPNRERRFSPPSARTYVRTATATRPGTRVPKLEEHPVRSAQTRPDSKPLTN